jgi:hypothetical protein
MGLLMGCSNDEKILNNLYETLNNYEVDFAERDWEKVVDYLPGEVLEEMLDQHHLKLSDAKMTMPDFKRFVSKISSSSFEDIEFTSVQLKDIGEKIEHDNRIFYRVRYESKGKLYVSDYNKYYDFYDKGFIIAVSSDGGKSFNLINYTNEEVKNILDNVYGNVTPYLKVSYSKNNLNELAGQILKDGMAELEAETKHRYSKLYDTYKRSVVRIVMSSEESVLGWGTGFVLGGYIITNNHLLNMEGAKYLQVLDFDNNPVDWDLIENRNNVYDFAMIELAQGHGLPSFPYYATDQRGYGDEVFTIGHPNGSMPNSFGKGIITGVNGFTYQVDIDATFGASGSPVFDADGAVIGILYGGEESNTATFVRDIRALNLTTYFTD